MDPHAIQHVDPRSVAAAAAFATGLGATGRGGDSSEPPEGETPIQGPSRWRFSVEQIVIFVTLLGGIVASFTLLSAKVDGLTASLLAVSARQVIIEDRLRAHELLPSHPVSESEFRHLKERLERIERDRERPKQP